MRFLRFRFCSTALAAFGSLLLMACSATSAHAAMNSSLPLLIGKTWLLGYALVFLAVLLGLLAVLIPSMRKTMRRRD